MVSGRTAHSPAPSSRSSQTTRYISMIAIGGSVGALLLLSLGRQSPSQPLRTQGSQLPSTVTAVFGVAAPRGTPNDNYPVWTSKHTSLVRRHLSPAIYQQLSPLATANGFTIDRVIQPAIDLPMANGVSIGAVAGDEESYTTFAPLFHPLIAEYHSYNPLDGAHVTDLDYSKLQPAFIPESYVISTRMRVGRSLKGLPFPPASNRAQRRLVERLVVNALLHLAGPYSGRYYPLSDMSEADRNRLIDDHFLFSDPDPWMMAAGLSRDWPDARGIFYNSVQELLVWVNEEDHVRVISMQSGSNAVKVFERLVDALNAIEESLSAANSGFAHSPKLGYLTSCPTNLGTGLRASMLVKLPNLAQQPDFKAYARTRGLQVRGKGGEKDKANTGVFDVSNLHRLGHSEVKLVQTMLDGVSHLITLEGRLSRGESVDLSSS